MCVSLVCLAQSVHPNWHMMSMQRCINVAADATLSQRFVSTVMHLLTSDIFIVSQWS